MYTLALYFKGCDLYHGVATRLFAESLMIASQVQIGKLNISHIFIFSCGGMDYVFRYKIIYVK